MTAVVIWLQWRSQGGHGCMSPCCCWKFFQSIIGTVICDLWRSMTFFSRIFSMSPASGALPPDLHGGCIRTFFYFYFYMFEWCSLLCVVRMGTSIDGRKPFWLPACVFFANKLSLPLDTAGGLPSPDPPLLSLPLANSWLRPCTVTYWSVQLLMAASVSQ